MNKQNGVTGADMVSRAGDAVARTIPSGSTIVVGDGAEVVFSNVVSLADIDDDELQAAYKRLRAKIDEYFDLVAETLHDNHYLQEESLERLQRANEILQEKSDDPAWVLSRAQFEVRRVHVAIAKEQRIQSGENRLRWIVPTLVIVYIAAIICVVAFGQGIWLDTAEIPVIGVPLSVMVWAALGSVAAILYRFYTRQRGRVSDEIRWLIARPIIGIIMGALAYVAVVSGLLIFGTATGADANAQNAKPQLLWLVAFLGGFSDRFFQTVVDSAMGRFSTSKQEQTSAQS